MIRLTPELKRRFTRDCHSLLPFEKTKFYEILEAVLRFEAWPNDTHTGPRNSIITELNSATRKKLE